MAQRASFLSRVRAQASSVLGIGKPPAKPEATIPEVVTNPISASEKGEINRILSEMKEKTLIIGTLTVEHEKEKTAIKTAQESAMKSPIEQRTQKVHEYGLAQEKYQQHTEEYFENTSRVIQEYKELEAKLTGMMKNKNVPDDLATHQKEVNDNFTAFKAEVDAHKRESSRIAGKVERRHSAPPAVDLTSVPKEPVQQKTEMAHSVSAPEKPAKKEVAPEKERRLTLTDNPVANWFRETFTSTNPEGPKPGNTAVMMSTMQKSAKTDARASTNSKQNSYPQEATEKEELRECWHKYNVLEDRRIFAEDDCYNTRNTTDLAQVHKELTELQTHVNTHFSSASVNASNDMYVLKQQLDYSLAEATKTLKEYDVDPNAKAKQASVPTNDAGSPAVVPRTTSMEP